MVEMLGLASMAELPVVIVDVQRAGPSTGMPTKHEQGDLLLAVSGGHGDVQRIVLAPTTVEDAFYQMVNAFNLAERYQLPVIVLSDMVLATRTERMRRPDLSSHPPRGAAAVPTGRRWRCAGADGYQALRRHPQRGLPDERTWPARWAVCGHRPGAQRVRAAKV